MSGIMAIVSLDGRPIPPELSRAQLAAIAHRGEWEPRLWEAPGIALGHVNLPRTPEAEREFLPAADASGRYWLTWDGRLDNREELAGKLGYDAAQRQGKTDAEYVLDAYARWGDECVHHLLGDWAVVIWDSQKRRLFCAKDPVGYRPLFFREGEGCLFVASEPDQLFAGCSERPQPDEDYTRRYLAGVLQVPGRTWLAGMTHLAGGEILAAAAASRDVTAYWTQPQITKRPYKRAEDYVDEFVDTFELAMQARLRTNRPIGVYLSGGIDSSYVAAIATKLGAQVTAITSYVPGTKRADEREYASIVAKHLDITQVELDVTDCWTLSSKWLRPEAFDAPFHPGQGAHQARIGIAAREFGLGIVLGGEGGDEWTNGPEAYVANTLAHGHPREAWRLARLHRSRPAAARRMAKESYRNLVPGSFRAAVRTVRGRRSGLMQSGPEWVDIFDRMNDVLQWRDGDYHRMEWEIYRQINWLEPQWRDRHESAPNLIERRPAFFDLRIINLMASTPAWVKRFKGRRKDVLREAERRVLPDVIPNRMDWGLFDEQLLRGLRAESGRVELASDALTQFTGDRPAVLAHFSGDGETGALPWEAWRAISTGLWLAHLRESPASRTEVRAAVGPSSMPTHAPSLGRR